MPMIFNIHLIFRPSSANSLAKSQNGSLGGEDSVAGDLGSNGDNINVVVRVRPLNPREIKAGEDSVLQVIKEWRHIMLGFING